MGKYFRYLAIGVLFGIVLTKAEAISWFRIQEMFRFDAWHMYGVIGSALAVGTVSVWAIKRWQARTLDGRPLQLSPKMMSVHRYLWGGIIFGLGWALTGACPGPLYILIGQGYGVLLVVLGSAVLGTFAYGVLKHRLPH
jgi:hypothetical protein